MEVPTAVGSLLSKLPALLGDEYKLQKGVKRDIEVLTYELQKIQVGTPHDSDEVFPRELRELSYDIEDSIDSFMMGVGHKPGDAPLGARGLVNKFKNLLEKLKSQHRMRQQIQELMSRTEEVSERHVRYMTHSNVSSRSSSVTVVDPGVPVLCTDSSSGLVGMDRPLEEISKLLLMEKDKEPESASQLKAVAIVGSGGMGKTTLAKAVWKTTREYFPCTVWVSVLPGLSMQRLLVDILRQVEEGPSTTVENSDSSWGECYGERDLIERIKGCLRVKRYLIVLDDLWSTETLKIIKPALPMNSFGSRVITTTCSHAVAESCQKDWNGDMYYIVPLSSKDSWILFQRRIFGSAGSCPTDLVDLANKFLRKCSGVPLAIITIGAILATKEQSRQTWEHLYNSIGTTHDSIEGMRDILLHSYYDLPRRLKECFLYLSIFPEDYPINCDRIIRCWIAEGFISEYRKNTLEETGESYLNELFSRNMIQSVHESYDGKPETFVVYGMMHDFIKTKSTEENLVTILETGKPLPVSEQKIRRLSVINTNEDRHIPTQIKSHIRSLFIFGSANLDLSGNDFPSLRLLDLEDCKHLKEHNINGIAEISRLRYLRIRHTPISLPEQIGQLHSLETLDFCGTSVQNMPRSIVRLHCDMIRVPRGIREMTALSGVSIYIDEVKNEDLRLLSELPLLRHLSLSSRAMPKEKLVIGSNGFPLLQKFSLRPARADLTFEPQTMQKLQEMQLILHALPAEEYVFSIDICHLMCLKKIDIRINGTGRAASQLLEAANFVIRKAAVEHSNHLVVNIV